MKIVFHSFFWFSQGIDVHANLNGLSGRRDKTGISIYPTTVESGCLLPFGIMIGAT